MNQPPNIVVILADDMGFSDLGCYGSEIRTPNLDRLAEGGLRFSQFYNAARCCPTRASLLTGLYPHQAGVGHMIGFEGEWKLVEDVRLKDGTGWELYNMETDRTELKNLAAEEPDIAADLLAQYNAWAQRVGV